MRAELAERDPWLDQRRDEGCRAVLRSCRVSRQRKQKRLQALHVLPCSQVGGSSCTRREAATAGLRAEDENQSEEPGTMLMIGMIRIVIIQHNHEDRQGGDNGTS